MTEATARSGAVWPVVLAQFEQHAPASVMARTALEHALPPDWVDAVFEAERQRQYARELMFSTVGELMTLGALLVLHTVTTFGIGAALLRFGMLERRAHRG